ncbi:transposase [Flavobacterium notoginsengisoli]|uniref:transposase n=1 Tax=Flavobacterium notoginsengisoli TaxID=1478199 RepID=UPI00363BA39C
MKKKPMVYSFDFKVEAVKLSYERGNIAEVEKELNITSSLLTRWRQDYQKYGTGSFPGTGTLRLSPDDKKKYELKKKIKDLDLKFEIFKKAGDCMYQGKFEIFQFIRNHEKNYSIRKMCKVLNFSTRTYSNWKNQSLSETQQKRILIKEEITKVFFNFQQRYGAQRIAKILQKNGYKISSSTTKRYMCELGLYCKISKN